VKERYVTYFPSSRNYFNRHGFAFYRLKLHRARYIGGFGDILWLESDSVRIPNPLEENERKILDHMNQDHGDSVLAYCRKLKTLDTESAQMVGIDSDGFDVLADGKLIRFEFDSPITTTEEAREVLVRMSQEAAEPGEKAAVST